MAGRARRIAEAPLTECETQDSDRRCSNPIVIRNDHAPGGRRHLESAKIVPGDKLTAGLLGLAFHHHVHLARGVVSEHARENRAGVGPDELEGGKREDSGGRCPFVITPGAAAHAPHHGIASGWVGAPIQHGQRLGIGDRQRAQQERIHEAIDRRVGSDAERQRQNRQHAERLVGCHRAKAVAAVLRQLFQPGPSPRGARLLLYQGDVSDVAARGAARFFAGQSLGLALFGFLIEMKLKFVAEILFLPAAVQQRSQLLKERAHCPSCSAGFTISRMARENVSHLDCSAASCLRPFACEAIEAGPLAFGRQIPGGGDPAFRLQAMERRIQGPGLDLEKVFRGSLNVFRDRVAVGGSGEERAEDKEIERASQQLNMGRRLVSHCVGILLRFV